MRLNRSVPRTFDPSLASTANVTTPLIVQVCVDRGAFLREPRIRMGIRFTHDGSFSSGARHWDVCDLQIIWLPFTCYFFAWPRAKILATKLSTSVAQMSQ